MQFKLLRFYALLVHSAFCVFVFLVGMLTDVSFFTTFIGPAIILLFIAFKPQFYYDIIAVLTIGLLSIITLIFSFISAFFNNNIGLAIMAPIIPIATFITLLYCMNQLKKLGESY